MVVPNRNSRFRLERVLEHRRRLTEHAQQTLAERARQRAAVEQALALTEQEYAALLDYQAEQVADPELDLDVLAAAEVYADHLRATALQQTHAWQAAQTEERAAREQFLDRRIDQRVLEKLRERQEREQAERQRAAEERLLDEIATLRYGNAPLTPGGAHDR